MTSEAEGTGADTATPPEFEEWRQAMRRVGAREGFFEPLGTGHAALYIERGDTLLVSFDRFGATARDALPPRAALAQEQNWSHLALTCRDETWFRDPRVFDMFDHMTDDGFFDEFARVLFYGAGPAGYAAAAFSVAAPGAQVVLLQPQATLDPDIAIWDERFTEMRALSFSDRYGYAPDMIEAAMQATLLYDPRETEDAMHAALFRRKNVTRVPLRSFGPALEGTLVGMEMLDALLVAAAGGEVTPALIGRLSRSRHDHAPYLRRLTLECERRGQYARALRVATLAHEHVGGRFFARRIRALDRTTADAVADTAAE
ncbi:phosphoadenosine phosphosulfate reductase [Litorisediminicola beolgyonensis]|uniref:Phosphoadenosine phosphosulfate reductase n=1 Tax=Litorisediminicola beolgyonensis TaxID=1173614 RepID=A0ABW3ZK86_9RHOB